MKKTKLKPINFTNGHIQISSGQTFAFDYSELHLHYFSICFKINVFQRAEVNFIFFFLAEILCILNCKIVM